MAFITYTRGFGPIWSIFKKRSLWVLSDKHHQTGSVLKVHFSWLGKTLVLASGWELHPPNGGHLLIYSLRSLD